MAGTVPCTEAPEALPPAHENRNDSSLGLDSLVERSKALAPGSLAGPLGQVGVGYWRLALKIGH